VRRPVTHLGAEAASGYRSANAFYDRLIKDRVNGKVYVVSNDKDWRRLCLEGDEFVHQGQLRELLEKFADSEVVSHIRQLTNDRQAEVKALLDVAAQDIYFVSLDGVEPEIEEPDSVDVTIDDFHVIEAKDGVATVSPACTLRYGVTITDDDPDSGWTDPDDGERRHVFRRSGSVEGEAELEAALTVNYDKARPDQVTLGGVKFTKPEVEVGFDDHDLQREDDGDYSGPDDEKPPDCCAEYEPPVDHDPPEDEEASDEEDAH
jgi:hypothetical protein